MKYPYNEALLKAIEITKAKLSNTNGSPDEVTGKATADYLEIVYNKVLEIMLDDKAKG